jgi:hypothetical protein
MARQQEDQMARPTLRVEVLERDGRARRGWLRCELGTNIKFNMTDLASYFFAEWSPTVYDELLVAAAVEFADRTRRRPALTWQREFELHIPVHDPSHWNAPRVSETLKDALVFLTSDLWHITFYKRRKDHERPKQGHFLLPARDDSRHAFQRRSRFALCRGSYDAGGGRQVRSCPARHQGRPPATQASVRVGAV